MLGFGFTELARRRRAAFSPASLSPAAWYDPSDPGTLFQDAAGALPVTADGDPVGMIRDKSGNGHHLTQSDADRKPLYHRSGDTHWLTADGINDGLSIPSRMGFGANPDIWVISAIRPLSLAATVHRLFHLGTENAPYTLAACLGSSGYAWRYNNGSAVFDVPAIGTDAVVSWGHPAGGTYADGMCRLNGTALPQASAGNAGFLPADTGAQASLFFQGSSTAGNPANIRFYGAIILSAAAPAALGKCESWLAAKSAVPSL